MRGPSLSVRVVSLSQTNSFDVMSVSSKSGNLNPVIIKESTNRYKVDIPISSDMSEGVSRLEDTIIIKTNKETYEIPYTQIIVE